MSDIDLDCMAAMVSAIIRVCVDNGLFTDAEMELEFQKQFAELQKLKAEKDAQDRKQ